MSWNHGLPAGWIMTMMAISICGCQPFERWIFFPALCSGTTGHCFMISPLMWECRDLPGIHADYLGAITTTTAIWICLLEREAAVSSCIKMTARERSAPLRRQERQPAPE